MRVGRRAAGLGVAGLGLAGAAHSIPALAPLAPGIASALGLTVRQGESAGVALTFDDGPHPQGTPRVLEALRAARAPATFFLVGERVARNPGLAAEIVAAGHRAELHCHRHRNQLRLTAARLRDDAERARAEIERATGRRVCDCRPPYGIFSASGLRVVRARGLRPVLWSLWAKDWRSDATPASIARRATSAAAAGDILLLHDSDYYSARGSWARTAAALPVILEELGEKGLSPVSLDR